MGDAWTVFAALLWMLGLLAAVSWWVVLGMRRYRAARSLGYCGGVLFCSSAGVTVAGATDWGEAASWFGVIALSVLLMLAVGWLVLRVQRNRFSRPAGIGALAAFAAMIACLATSPHTTAPVTSHFGPAPLPQAAASDKQRTTPPPPEATPAPQAPAAQPAPTTPPPQPEQSVPVPAPPFGAPPTGVGPAAAPAATECAYEIWGPASYGMGDWVMSSGEVLDQKYGNKWYLRFPVGTPTDTMERVVSSEFRRHRKDKVVFPNGRSFKPTEMTLFVYHTMDPFTRTPKVPGADGADRSYMWKQGQQLKREFP